MFFKLGETLICLFTEEKARRELKMGIGGDTRMLNDSTNFLKGWEGMRIHVELALGKTRDG